MLAAARRLATLLPPMRRFPWLFFTLVVACGGPSVPSPFEDSGVPDASSAGGADDGATPPPVDTSLGGPCRDDAQCDDEIDCTVDRCDEELGRCRYQTDDDACQDGVYCNGVERCALGLGCVQGDAVSCSDDRTCTIDTCVEDTRSCRHAARDADSDGDPVWNCGDGGDCNDQNALINSQASERCGNGVDDDCDGERDEDDCIDPAHDRCGDAFVIEASGTYEVSLAAAGADYGASCLPQGATFRDVVLSIRVPEGDPADVDIAAIVASAKPEPSAPKPGLALASASKCGKADTETACDLGLITPDGDVAARLRLHQLEPGSHSVLVLSDVEQPVLLRVSFEEPTPPPENETCGSAAVLEPDTDIVVAPFAAAKDLESRCKLDTGELVYAIDLEEASDVRVSAVALDELGEPVLSLRNDDCSDVADEITCRRAPASQLFARLDAGSYRLAVGATGPTEVALRLEVGPRSEAPPGDACQGAPDLDFDHMQTLSLEGYTDQVQSCLPGAVDVAYRLVLQETSDVLLVEQLSSDDQGALSLAASPCQTDEDVIACQPASFIPRLSLQELGAGPYRVVAESRFGNPIGVSAFVRDHLATRTVLFSDRCDDVFEIPEGGGRFIGNTQGFGADYTSGCDIGLGLPGGARDQILKLSLGKTQRVVLDMQGSEYETLLSVRRGPSCPGMEVFGACSRGDTPQRSYVDAVLEAGTYFIQIDGFGEEDGSWQLDAYVVDP